MAVVSISMYLWVLYFKCETLHMVFTVYQNNIGAVVKLLNQR